ncbi:hypothetical protein BH10CYA1_BH10CYA1_14970 [soil metagenome]
MEPRLLERQSTETGSTPSRRGSQDNRLFSQARADLAGLERSYKSSNSTLQPLVFGLIAAVMVLTAYNLFGGRVDRHMFTTDVTPIHVELNAIAGRKQTAQNRQNAQM